jgi:hypothetical protein
VNSWGGGGEIIASWEEGIYLSNKIVDLGGRCVCVCVCVKEAGKGYQNGSPTTKKETSEVSAGS